MLRGRAAAGIVVLAVGVLLVAYGLVVLSGTSVTVPTSSNVLFVTPGILGTGSITLSWSGAANGTEVLVSPCSDASCTNVGAPIATAYGVSGAVTVSVTGGSTYAVNQSGNGPAFPAKISESGITPLLLIGAVVAVIGALVLALAFRAPSRRPAPAPKASPPPVRAPPPKPTLPVAAAPVEAYSVYPPAAEEEPAVEEEEPAPAPAPGPGGLPASFGGRAPIVCAACGTANEPWLHNCRFCKRALTSTGA